MTSPHRLARRTRRVLAAALLASVVAGAPAASASVSSRGSWPSATAAAAGDPDDLAVRGWVWPVAAFHVERPFVAPVHAYGPGHRGIDLRPSGGDGVRAPADGIVAFSGPVAGRGILTIDHGDGLVTTLEPVASSLVTGDRVDRGAEVGAIAAGGHTPVGVVHFGVRRHGEYINPLALLGGVPRAVLLPCCD